MILYYQAGEVMALCTREHRLFYQNSNSLLSSCLIIILKVVLIQVL